ncbi:MAG: proline racemase, partial [Woeseia sp.]|nr:proline racemase [Woeseia sp.]
MSIEKPSFTPVRSVRTIDSHTEGNPTRVIVDGVPVPPGETLLDKQKWLVENDDTLRRMLCFEPRGGGLMCSVFLMPPIAADADFSVVIMEQDAYVPMSGHCIIGAATTVVEAALVDVVSPITTVRFETPAGIV